MPKTQSLDELFNEVEEEAVKKTPPAKPLSPAEIERISKQWDDIQQALDEAPEDDDDQDDDEA
jgi:hypothetical protein